MTLANICILAACVCAVWMLGAAARAEMPMALPEGQGLEGEYLPTVPRTQVRSGFRLPGEQRDDTTLAPDVDEEAPLDEWQPPASRNEQPAAGTLSPFSQTPGFTGLAMPLVPGGMAWRQTYGDSAFTERVWASVPFVQLGPPRDTCLSQNLGPLSLDLYSVSFIAAYSDLQGMRPPPNEDSGFLAAVSLTGALRLELSESAALAVGFTVYYIPTVNRVGFYFGATSPITAASFTYETEIGRWEIKVEDVFRVYSPLGDLLRQYEVDEIAMAGTYRFGRLDALSDRSLYNEDVFFTNSASISAVTRLDEDWKLRLRANEVETWSGTRFQEYGSVLLLGADVVYDSPDLWFMPWASYDYMDFFKLDRTIHRVLVGAIVPVTPTFRIWARAGMSFTTLHDVGGNASNRQTFDWEIGLVHELNEDFSHSLFAGHNDFVTDYGDDFTGTYWRYTVSYHPRGSSWVISANVQDQQGDRELSPAYRYTSWGARATCALSEATNLTLFYIDGRFTQDALVARRRISGATLSHSFSRSVSGFLTCHFSRYDSSSPGGLNFEEHLFIAGLTFTF